MPGETAAGHDQHVFVVGPFHFERKSIQSKRAATCVAGLLDTQITIEVVTKERIQLVNTIMSSSWKWKVDMCVRVQRKCCAEHYGDGVCDGSETGSFSR